MCLIESLLPINCRNLRRKKNLIQMRHEYSDKCVTPWGGMKEMKELVDKTKISEKIAELISLQPNEKLLL
jgi:hypothetical protein